MMGSDEIVIIVVSVLCVVFVIAAIIACSIYFCCGSKKRKPTRYQLPPPESTNGQSTPVHQDEPAPKPLPKVGSTGLWMSKPIMHAQGPNDAYHQLKPNGVRTEPVMMREILSTPNINQPTGGYVYQGNLRMYHSQQLPGLASGYGEHRGAYYNEAFIYPTYVDAGLSHRSSMRFFEASGYYAPEHMARENHMRASRHHSHRDSGEARPPRANGDLRHKTSGAAKPSRYQANPPLPEQRNSRSIESRSSSKNKSVSSSTASGTESVIERSAAHEANKSSASAPASETVRSRIEEMPSHRNEDVRTQADGKTKAEVNAPSTSTQHEPGISLDNLGDESQDIPSDQQSNIESVSDITDMESKGQKITTAAFEFLDTYPSDVDEDMDRPKYYSGKT